MVFGGEDSVNGTEPGWTLAVRRRGRRTRGKDPMVCETAICMAMPQANRNPVPSIMELPFVRHVSKSLEKSLGPGPIGRINSRLQLGEISVVAMKMP